MKLHRLFLALCLALLVAPSLSVSAQAPGCEFKLGFKLIADQMSEILGGCLENEHSNPLNGDALQQTSKGLLVWRKFDNFTAFTDGYRSWVNGPFGIQQRLNTEQFDWEPIPPEVPAPVATVAPQPVPAQLAAPVVTFSIDNTTFTAGQCVTARWSTTNARAVFLLGAGIDGVGLPASGERLVCPTGTTTYALNVVDSAGATSSRGITVTISGNVAPSVSFTADRTTMNLGECATLRWDVSNVKEIHLRGPDLDIGVTGQGDRGVCPRGSSSTYRLDVTDLSSNTATYTITINIPNAVATPVPQPTASQPTTSQPTATVPPQQPIATQPPFPPTPTPTPIPPTPRPSVTAPVATATSLPATAQPTATRPPPTSTPRP